MIKVRTIETIFTHTAGETTCLVVNGIHFPSGLSIREKRNYAEERLDWIRTAIMREPRGHKDLYGGIITPSNSTDADYDVLWMDGGGFADMCGHGTIALGMVLVALGWTVESSNSNPEHLNLQTTVGKIDVEVGHSDRTVDWCRFQNVPAYVMEENVEIALPEVGTVYADIVYAGVFFGLIRWPDNQEKRIGPENGRFFGELGNVAKKAINAKVSPRHPVNPLNDDLDLVTFYHASTSSDATYRCVHTYRNGKTDRSPGGTGTSAMMALLEHRGEIEIGEKIFAEGLLGGAYFEGCLIDETKLGSHRAVVPTIKGKSEIIGFNKMILNQDDPIGLGYEIS